MATLLWPLRYYGHLIITATLLHVRPCCYYGHPVITATLFWPEQKLSQPSYLKNPFNMTTL